MSEQQDLPYPIELHLHDEVELHSFETQPSPMGEYPGLARSRELHDTLIVLAPLFTFAYLLWAHRRVRRLSVSPSVDASSASSASAGDRHHS